MIQTAAELVAVARERGVDLGPESIHADDSGLDFLAFQARDRNGMLWILRAPRRPDVLPVAEAENRVLAVVRPRLPVGVPEWRIRDSELIGYPKLPGRPAAVMNVAEQRFDWVFDPEHPPEAFVESLAETLVALHGIDPEAAAGAGLEFARQCLAACDAELHETAGP